MRLIRFIFRLHNQWRIHHPTMSFYAIVRIAWAQSSGKKFKLDENVEVIEI